MKKILLIQFAILSTLIIYAQDDPYAGYKDILNIIKGCDENVIIYHIPNGNTAAGEMKCLTSGKIREIFSTGVLIESIGQNVKVSDKGLVFEGGGSQTYFEYLNFDKIIKLKVIKKPEIECDDPNCPFHGNLNVRGRVLIGHIISDRMDKTVVVKRSYTQYDPKYERYSRVSNKIPAHNSPCIEVKQGDRVRIAECRPISKTKSFVVIEKLEEVE